MSSHPPCQSVAPGAARLYACPMRPVLAALSLALPSTAQSFDPDGPFRPGEGFGAPATCDTLGDWIDRAPDTGARVSMTVDGAITASEFDGALAYLVMCPAGGVQVMCVTYDPRAPSPEVVRFAGGYARVGDRQVMLDPCLVYPVD